MGGWVREEQLARHAECSGPAGSRPSCQCLAYRISHLPAPSSRTLPILPPHPPSPPFLPLQVDGLGDGAMVECPGEDTDFLRTTAFGLLQGCRMRNIKTEYVSCPSCGRTLFNLQEVTDQIRTRTGHLPGVAIAVMGCIVNGPGARGVARRVWAGRGGEVASGRRRVDEWARGTSGWRLSLGTVQVRNAQPSTGHTTAASVLRHDVMRLNAFDVVARPTSTCLRRRDG